MSVYFSILEQLSCHDKKYELIPEGQEETFVVRMASSNL